MKNYLKLWADGLQARHGQTISRPIDVTGHRDKHLGPTWQFASVDISLEPSDIFLVVDQIEDREKLSDLGYIEWFVFGFLDVFLSQTPPLVRVKMTLKSARHDEIRSSRIAFLEAGRDAAKKALDTLK